MMVVYKYVLKDPVDAPQMVRLPKGAKILQVHEQYGRVAMWFSCDPSLEPTEDRMFIVLQTGTTAVGDNLTYLGSAHLRDGRVVLHVFEVV